MTKGVMDFRVLMDKISTEMWQDKDKAIQKYETEGTKTGKKPYRYDDNFYTTANDLRWRWERNWRLCEEIKVINAPKGSKMEKCRYWLKHQERTGMMDSMFPKRGCISGARFKRKNKPWGSNTEGLMTVRSPIVHLSNGLSGTDRGAYCQSRKKKPVRKHPSWKRTIPKMIRSTKNKDEVTCKQCLNLMKSNNPDIQKEIIILTIQNDA